MKNLIFILSFLLSLFLFNSCQSSSIPPFEGRTLKKEIAVLRSQVDKAIATPNETIRFEILLDTEPQISLDIPQIGDQIQGLRIVDEGKSDPLRRDGRNQVKRWYDLQADIIGSYVLPGIEINAKTPEGEINLKTAKIFIKVKTPAETKEDENQGTIRDIKPLAVKEIPLKQKLIWGFMIVFSILVIGAILYYAKRWSQRKPIESPIPADRYALERLEKLKREFSDSWDIQKENLRKSYYFRLSEIFRDYLERRFAFPATDFTTEEIYSDLKNRLSLGELTEDPYHLAKGFLADSDLVKFTDIVPSKEDPKRLWQLARNFVMRTRIVPSVTEEGIVIPPIKKGNLLKSKHG